MPDIDIRTWSPDLPVPGITALLHTAYAPLAGMGFRYMATHQDDSMTFQRLSAGWSFLASIADTLVGTIVLSCPGPFRSTGAIRDRMLTPAGPPRIPSRPLNNQ